MRAVVQRVENASVSANGCIVGSMNSGLLVYLGVAAGDSERDADYLAEKIVNLRIFTDSEGKMNLSLLEHGGGILAVSQFTLLADARKGRRPSYGDAETPEAAQQLYERFIAKSAQFGIAVSQGAFQEHMRITYVNDGPVTILLDSRKLF